MRIRRGVRMRSEKSSAKTLTGSAGRAVPAASRAGWTGRVPATLIIYFQPGIGGIFDSGL